MFERLVVASPDPGGGKRAQLWRKGLALRLGQPVGFAVLDKRRSEGRTTGAQALAGDVDGARVLRAAGAQRVLVCDSMPGICLPAQGALRDKLRVVPCAPLLASAIRYSHAAWLR